MFYGKLPLYVADDEGYRDEDPDAPIYEAPPDMYTAETIMNVLLNPPLRVCKKCPRGVRKSATYVVDVTALSHPDDVKKDDFGRWNHKGSHPIPFYVAFRSDGTARVERCHERAEGDNVYYLRRLHCTHPSNPNMKRLLAFLTGVCIKCKFHFPSTRSVITIFSWGVIFVVNLELTISSHG